MPAARDPVADEIEALLSMWGAWARRTKERLGYPHTSSISNMVDSVKVFPKRGKGSGGLTARGKQTRVMTAPKIGYVDPRIMAVDRIVARAPGAYHKLIYRRYYFGQPDRIACFELRMLRDEYTRKANLATQYVVEQLELLTKSGSLTVAAL